MFDIIIKNGTIIDGAGKKKFQGDIGITDNKIEAIDNIKGAQGRRVIDAKGLFVTPGFIDIHNHSDSFWSLFIEPRLESLIRQGITTIICGNCGSSLAPLIKASAIESIQKWADIRKVNINWLKLKELFRELKRRKIGLNFGTLVGHATLRRGLLKDEVRPITEKEIKIMIRMLEEALREGAFGMSTGLIYSHARLATTEEIIKLAETVKNCQGIYTSHIRGEDGDLLPAINETIMVGEASKVSVEISHLKAIGKKSWPDMIKGIRMIEVASKGGLDINFDVYPYTITGSVLYALLPSWVAEGGKKILISRLKDPVIKAKVISEMQRNRYEYDKIIISICPANKDIIGKQISEIAAFQKVSVEEAIINTLITSNGQVICFNNVLSEKNVRMALKHPLSLVGTNGAGYNLQHAKSGELVHPRCFGAFPRVLGKYVRQEKLLKWEEAINKMTGKPADKLKLKKRGFLKKGYFADITIFNPKTIIDKATFENPYQYPEGIEYVIINGKIVVEKGKHTGVMAGTVLHKE